MNRQRQKTKAGEPLLGLDGEEDAGVLRQKRRHRLRMLLLSMVCLVVCFAARVPQRIVFLFDQRSAEGDLAGMSEKERLRLLQQASDESQFTFRINARMRFESGDAQGILFIENPKENKSLLKVRITLNEDGRVLYESGYLKPGTGIGKDKLKELLPAGVYKATALFTAYDSKEKESGKAQAAIEIIIEK